MDCSEARNLITGSAIIRACDVAPDRSLRIQTTFEYPGNENVDVFVRHSPDGGPIELTDAGMTVGQLLGFGVDIDGTERRRQFVRNVCDQLGILRDRGQFVAIVPEPIQDNFGPTAVRLAQACVRIADLIITHQSRLNSTFLDEIEEGLDSLGFPVTPGALLRGNHDRDVRVDYVVNTPRLPTAIIGVSAKAQATAQNRVNATFRKWYELSSRATDFQFVTLLDSRFDVWREADRTLLEDVSEVFEYPAEADAFRELVAAD